MKRIVCFLLALIMVMGLIPNAAVNANAYSTRETSDKAINILTGSVTFYKKVTSGKVGYSTPISAADESIYLNGISKEDARELMEEYIEDVVDEEINAWAKSNNIDLNQYEHDALAVHRYRAGEFAKLKDVVRTVKTVNSAADRAAMVQAFVDSYSHNMSSSETLKPTLDVALAEAAMYLYGDYGYNGGSKLAYARLSIDGDNDTDKVLGYVKNDGLTLQKANYYGGLSDTEFLGWFAYDYDTKGPTGAPITKLTKDHDGDRIVAKKATGGNDAAEYTINTSTLSDLNVYSYGSTPVKTDVQLEDDTEFEVIYEYLDSNGVKWVFGTGTSTDDEEVNGWIKVGKVETSGTTGDKPIATATITSATLNIRAGATAGSQDIGDLKKNDVVNIYEIKVEKTETGNQNWGKIVNTKDANGNIVTGWINLAYADVNGTNGESGEAAGQTGRIANEDEVNIRSDAGITSPKITSLEKGTKVTVLKTQMVGDAQWGKIKWSTPSDGYTEGWVYMHYVLLDSAPSGSTGSSSETVKYTGVVTSNINLNVRKHADIYSTKVDSLPNGTKVNIYETKTKNNMKWGRIGENRWVCLAYVSLTEVEQPKDNATSTTTTLQATVTATTLNILKNYNSNAEKVGALKKGDVVTILEKNTEATDTGTRIWGRISTEDVSGWINLAYVELKTVTSVNGSTSSGSSSTTNHNGAVATVSNCISVNVRKAAGTRNAQITRLNNGTVVNVYEQVTKDNAPWARIKWNNGANEGWVCMNYLTVNAAGVPGTSEGGLVNGTNSNTISATGIVNSNIDLNVRSGAGLGYAKVGSLKKGTKVTIFEQVSADGMIWGRMNYANGTGWVCMSYITVESASSTGKGVMGTVARCFKAVNVRSAPGTGNALVATINVGSRVEVFETREYSNQMWGRVAQGWVCMDYVLLDSELPPGTVLDATVPTTEATKPGAENETVNRDGEIAFKVEASILKDLNVRNDADKESDRVGTIKAGLVVDIRAIKNNGAELWGRIDQYATAGWINMDKANVNYGFYGYVNTDEQPIYVDANSNSTVKGTLPINKMLLITKVTTDGTNVYGWVEEGIFGWIPMNKISDKEVEVIRTYKNGEKVGDFSSPALTGKTFAAMDAYDSIGGSKVLFKMTSGVEVAVDMVKFENGKVLGMLVGSYGEYAHAWIDMSKVNYSVPGYVDTEMNVRSSMENSSETNIIAKLPALTTINVCQFTFDGNGNVWARINGNPIPDTEINGAFVMVMTASKEGSNTVYVKTAVTP